MQQLRVGSRRESDCKLVDAMLAAPFNVSMTLARINVVIGALLMAAALAAVVACLLAWSGLNQSRASNQEGQSVYAIVPDALFGLAGAAVRLLAIALVGALVPLGSVDCSCAMELHSSARRRR